MKRPFTSLPMLAILIYLLLLCLPARAQFGGVTTTTATNFVVWTGNTNAPMTYNGTPATNIWTLTPPSKYIVLTNVLSTNEVFIGSIYIQIPLNLLTNFAGYSNLVLIGTVTNSFALPGGVPGNGVWSTNTIPVAGSVPFPIILGASNGTWTNGIFCQ